MLTGSRGHRAFIRKNLHAIDKFADAVCFFADKPRQGFVFGGRGNFE